MERTYEADSENCKKGYRLLLGRDIPCNGTYGVEAFDPGEDVRYHVTFAMTDASDPSSNVVARGRTLNLTGAAWLTEFRRKKTLTEGNYHWPWDKTVPAEATSGSEAEMRITLKMFDAPDGTLLSKHRQAKNSVLAAGLSNLVMMQYNVPACGGKGTGYNLSESCPPLGSCHFAA